MSKVFHCHYFFGQTFLVFPASCSHLSSQISAGWVLVHFNFHHYAANCFCGLFFNREADIATTKRLFLFTFLGLDNSGLSDPFAKIYICDQSRATQVKCKISDFWHYFWFSSQVIDETLSPTWDELLVFPRLVVHGRREDIKRTPPLVTIEIYDYDKVRPILG